MNKKETFYFTHDYNSRADEKIKKLIYKHGMLGYGIFWAIIEDLYNNENVLRLDCERIAFDLRTDINTINSVINDFDLFVISNNTFGSLSIQNRIELRNEKSKKARQSAFYRWNKKQKNANALPTQCDSNAIKESKVKESKENKKEKIDKKNFREFVTLSDKEYETLITKYGTRETEWMLDKLNSYKQAKGKNYKSDYGAINQWVVETMLKYKNENKLDLFDKKPLSNRTIA